MNIDRDIKCLPVYQNQQDFLIGVFKIGTILKFTKYTKRLIVDYDEDNLPIYNPEIQREIEGSRVQKIADFLIEDPNATFPTNLVLHLPSVVIEDQKLNNGFVEITFDEKVYLGVEKSKRNDEAGDVYITIIDGQHRLRGIEIALNRLDEEIRILTQTMRTTSNKTDLELKYNKFINRRESLLNIQLVVSFFIDKSLEYQAMIFSTINRTQKRVSESLVSSLFGLTNADSPQKTALQVVLILNAHEKSPFFNRINLYGQDYNKNQSPPLSQSGMVKSIINLISENLREAERDRYKERKELFKRTTSSKKSLPFREYYAKDNDNKISDILFYYYNAVRKTFLNEVGQSLWDFNPETMKPSNILQTTAGYSALLNLLVDLLNEIPEEKRYSSDHYAYYLKRANSLDVRNNERYPFTSKSKSVFYLDLNLAIWPPTTVDDSRVLRLNELLQKGL